MRRHTMCALVTGVHTFALPFCRSTCSTSRASRRSACGSRRRTFRSTAAGHDLRSPALDRPGAAGQDEDEFGSPPGRPVQAGGSMAETPAGVIAADTVTRPTAAWKDAVLVAGSHGGVYAAYCAVKAGVRGLILNARSEEHTSELRSLMSS